MTWNGGTGAASSPSGPAGGDLSGTYPTPVVSQASAGLVIAPQPYPASSLSVGALSYTESDSPGIVGGRLIIQSSGATGEAWIEAFDATANRQLLFNTQDSAGLQLLMAAGEKTLTCYEPVNFHKVLEVGDNVIGFFNKAPIVQPTAITAPTGGVVIDVEARAAIVSILNVLGASAGGFGLTA